MGNVESPISLTCIYHHWVTVSPIDNHNPIMSYISKPSAYWLLINIFSHWCCRFAGVNACTNYSPKPFIEQLNCVSNKKYITPPLMLNFNFPVSAQTVNKNMMIISMLWCLRKWCVWNHLDFRSLSEGSAKIQLNMEIVYALP